MKPILIVGQGIAGTVLALNLRKQGIPFFIIDDGHRSASSLAAAGLYNPLILKRGKLTWRAHDFFGTCEEFYQQCERDLGVPFLNSNGLFRRIHNTQEYNNWAVLKESSDLGAFIEGYIDSSEFPMSFDLPYDTCKVKGGWLDVKSFLTTARESFKAKGEYLETVFRSEDMNHEDEGWSWRGMLFKDVILCTGYKSMEDKRFFPGLQFTPAKGHTMDIHWPDLKLDKVIQASVFVLPLGNDTYRVGSTYSWTNLNETVEEDEIDKLKTELRKLCDKPFTLLEKRAGVRPAVKDRRPLIGESTEEKGIWHFGGFGSRAVLTCPTLALEFIEKLIRNTELSSEIDLNSRAR